MDTRDQPRLHRETLSQIKKQKTLPTYQKKTLTKVLPVKDKQKNGQAVFYPMKYYITFKISKPDLVSTVISQIMLSKKKMQKGMYSIPLN
jgi:hypothetical protein